MQPMYYIYFLIIPLVIYMIVRNMRSQSKWKQNNTQFQLQAIAQRLKLHIEKGEPTFNLLVTERSMPFAPRTVQALLHGTPYTHPFVLSYYDERYTEEGLFEKKHVHVFDSFLSMTTESELPPFEILTKPAAYGAAESTTEMPTQSFGDAALDQHLTLKTNDATLGPKLAPVLGALLNVGYVHIVAQGKELRFVFNEIGMMTAIQQLDALVYTLESVACVLEGKTAPGMLESAPAAGASADSAATAGAGTPAPSTSAVSISQVPMPCKVCGAPMKEISSGALNEPVHMKCSYCDAEETLPPDATQRVTALRARLSQMKWAQSAEQASGQAFAMASEKGVWLPGILLLSVVLGFQVVQLYNHIVEKWASMAAVDAEARARAVGEMLSGQGLSFGLMLGALFAMISMWLTYRFSVRKTLLARPPLEPNHPMRCRQCGGDLPNQVGPFIACAFCKTQNLVSATIARNQASLLDQEVQEYRKRAAERAGEFKKTVSSAVTSYYVALGIGVAVGIGLYVLARFLVPVLLG